MYMFMCIHIINRWRIAAYILAGSSRFLLHVLTRLVVNHLMSGSEHRCLAP